MNEGIDREARRERRRSRRASRATLGAPFTPDDASIPERNPAKFYRFELGDADVSAGVAVTCRSYQDALLVPLTDGVVPGRFLGAAYDRLGRIIVDSERAKANSAWSGNPSRLPGTVTAQRTLEGRTFFAGYLRDVFGHFLLEALPRFWPDVDYSAFDHFVFYPTDIDPTAEQVKLGQYALDMFDALGVDPSRAVLVRNETLACEELVVSTSAFGLKQYATPEFLYPFDRIATNGPQTPSLSERVYLSRARLERYLRGADNENEVEDAFRARGFAIVYPEQMTIAEQVGAVRGADVVAGCDGSNLHLVAFARPGTQLIALDSRFVANQIMIERVRGVDATHVHASATKLSRRERSDRWLAAIPRIEAELDALGIR